MDELILGEKTYTKASVAARNAGYTSDYVGQLCRGKKIDARLVGRTWYVNADELGVHQVEKRRMARVKAREQVQRSIAEQREQQSESQSAKEQHVSIRYETDESDLLPTVRKLSPKVEREARRSSRMPTEEIGDEFTIENKGNSVQMSGEILVKDAEEDGIDTESIVLTPKIIRNKKNIPNKHAELGGGSPILTTVSDFEDGTDIKDEQSEKASINSDIEKTSSEDFNFLDRLAENGALSVDSESISSQSHQDFMDNAEVAKVIAIRPTAQSGDWGIVTTIIGLALLCHIVFLIVNTRIVYSQSNTGTSTSISYHVDFESLIKYLK